MNRGCMRWAHLGMIIVATASCERVIDDVDLERMIRQRKCLPYSECRWLPGDHTMQQPLPGTVARSHVVGEPALTKGVVDGEPISFVPLEVDMGLMRRGAQRFEIFCAACHGVLGNGDTRVAVNMALRRPPSLHEPRIVAYAPGTLYRIVTRGYGLMPSFEAELSLEDRWAVVAYVGALQLSQRVVLEEQPPEARRAIEEALR
jgi:mono/diheme cytochrome c family protein